MNFRWVLLWLLFFVSLLTASTFFHSKSRSERKMTASLAPVESKVELRNFQSIENKGRREIETAKSFSNGKASVANIALQTSEMDSRSELQRDVLRDLSDLAQQNGDEKNFLLNEVGLTEAQYLSLLAHQKETHQQLREMQAWAQAFGVNPDEAKRPILEKHIQWMQSFIGVGNYARLQEIALSQFNF